MGAAEAVAGRDLPAVADAVASGSLPTPAPAHTWGSGRGEGCSCCIEDYMAGGQNMLGTPGWEMLTLAPPIDLSDRILIGARSGEQEPCSCLHCGRHSGVKVSKTLKVGG